MKKLLDDYIREGDDTGALRHIAKEYYANGKMGHTYKLTIERAADEIDHLTAELAKEKARAERAERRYIRKCREDCEDILPVEYTGTIHHLKTVQPYYDASESLLKTFEIRKDDRGYKVGDILHLKEWDGSDYTYRTHYRQITYALRDAPYVPDGYVCLGLIPITAAAVNDAKSEWRDLDDALNGRR